MLDLGSFLSKHVGVNIHVHNLIDLSSQRTNLYSSLDLFPPGFRFSPNIYIYNVPVFPIFTCNWSYLRGISSHLTPFSESIQHHIKHKCSKSQFSSNLWCVIMLQNYHEIDTQKIFLSRPFMTFLNITVCPSRQEMSSKRYKWCSLMQCVLSEFDICRNLWNWTCWIIIIFIQDASNTLTDTFD